MLKVLSVEDALFAFQDLTVEPIVKGYLEGGTKAATKVVLSVLERTHPTLATFLRTMSWMNVF